jgi:hypothetical protein
VANITDLTGNVITQVDLTSVNIGEDSNINVFEFGNLILADILPTLLWFVGFLSDDLGSLVSEVDDYGSTLIEEDLYGSSVSLIDSSVGISTDSNINVYEFGNLLLADILPTLLWLTNYVSDETGSEVEESDSLGILLEATELSGSSLQIADSEPELSLDSNVNVFEFGNLILADTLLAWQYLSSYLEELSGSSLSFTDREDSGMIVYNSAVDTYDAINISYKGYIQ